MELLLVGVGLALALGGAVTLLLRYRGGDAGEVYARFAARPASRDRRLLGVGVGLYLLVGGGLLALSLSRGGRFVTLSSAMVVVAGLLLAAIYLRQEQRVAVAEHGLRVGKTLHGWDAIEGATFTEDALVVERSGWRPPFSYDRGGIDDEAAVGEALSRFVPVRNS